METFEEEWKRVKGSSTHEVSNKGRVRNLTTDRILKAPLATHGYPQVSVEIYGCYYIRRVHRLVAEAFVRPLEKGNKVHHKDGNRSNNIYTNLIVCKDSWEHELAHKKERALTACGHEDWIKHNKLLKSKRDKENYKKKKTK